jgi:hypothetical protein
VSRRLVLVLWAAVLVGCARPVTAPHPSGLPPVPEYFASPLGPVPVIWKDSIPTERTGVRRPREVPTARARDLDLEGRDRARRAMARRGPRGVSPPELGPWAPVHRRHGRSDVRPGRLCGGGRHAPVHRSPQIGPRCDEMMTGSAATKATLPACTSGMNGRSSSRRGRCSYTAIRRLPAPVPQCVAPAGKPQRSQR